MEQKMRDRMPGDVLQGFEIVNRQEIAAVGATLFMLRHQKTGAQVLYSSRDCENKTFAIAFETLPEDHTGVFHILEHSVLNGSEKYPVKEPFVNLLQSSLQTFLNAMTFPDKTVYPVSSRNQQDFENLMRVYLDGVFRPAIYKKPEIFRQEGWHYQMESADKVPTYNGVVFSEMKGAFSSVDNLMEQYTQQLLFPDNCYGFCSGGDPAHIPELTYEHFIKTHQRFYHPSNAKVFLDGDMELEPILRYLDQEYFSHYSYQEKDFAIADQKPVQKTMQLRYQVTQEQEQFAHFVLSKIICKFDDIEEIYAGKLLCDYLTGSNEAPLQRAILEAGLGQDVSVEFTDGVYQPFVEFRVRNTQPEHFDKICQVLKETVKSQLSQGLDMESLSAALERYAFRCREVDEPYGLMLCLKSLDTWLYGGDPTAHWNTEPIFAALREKLEGDYFPNLLQKMLGDPESMCRLEMLPSTTKGQEEAARDAEKLQKLFESWTEEKREETLQEYQAMSTFQQTPDSEEALATLPSLNLADIPLRPAEVKSSAQDLQGCPFVRTHIDTHGIVYLNLYFSLADFTPEQLQMTEVMNTALGELSTKQYAGVKLQSRIKTWLGSLETKIELISAEGDLQNCTPYLAVSASMLEENADKALELLAEILLGTQFAELDRMEELLRQNEYYMKQSLTSSGHAYAITKALAPFSVQGTLKEVLSGESSILWLTKLLETFKQDGQKIMQTLSQMAQKIFCRSRLVLGAGGEIADFIDMRYEGEVVAQPGFGEALLTVGVCETMGIGVGDTVILRNADMQELQVTVSGIYENYVQNFAVVSPETIASQWGEDPELQMALVKAEDPQAVSTKIANMDGIMTVLLSRDNADAVGQMMGALDSVMWLVVLAAGMLAVVVLYNLINININERIREIATIKVLGFHSGETASYVFKENMVLSVIGSIAGLGLGKLLLEFVLLQVKVDTVWFQSKITFFSLAISVALTLVATLIVQFIFTFKIERINMAEALKSVE